MCQPHPRRRQVPGCGFGSHCLWFPHSLVAENARMVFSDGNSSNSGSLIKEDQGLVVRILRCEHPPWELGSLLGGVEASASSRHHLNLCSSTARVKWAPSSRLGVTRKAGNLKRNPWDLCVLRAPFWDWLNENSKVHHNFQGPSILIHTHVCCCSSNHQRTVSSFKKAAQKACLIPRQES